MKAVRICLLVLIIIGLGFIFTQDLWVPSVVNWIISYDQKEVTPVASLQIATSTQKIQTPAANLFCKEVCKSFDLQDYFKNEKDLGSNNVYIDPVSSTTITFKVLTDTEHQARNLTLEVYVNGKLAGQTGGQGIAQTSFSPDHKYFAFTTRSTIGCAGGCQEMTLNVVDLISSTVMDLLVHPDNSNENTRQFTESGTFIESYIWGDRSITLTAYSVGFTNEQSYYRIHPKEKWSFDLSIPQSVMRNGVATKLPE